MADVFDINLTSQDNNPVQTTLDVTDFNLQKQRNGTTYWFAQSRLTGNAAYLRTNDNTQEYDYSTSDPRGVFDTKGKVRAYTSSSNVIWSWKRAPNYFDVVTWTGNDTAGRTVAHNLGVVPEMIWVKNRSDSVEWAVYHKDLSQGNFLKLNGNDAATGAYVFGANSSNDAQSATNIILSSSNMVNELNKNYIGYLFATVAGISKIGSYTGNGSTQNIDCGFSNGARFVLTKQTGNAGHWVLFDSERGIVAGNDARLKPNRTDAEVTGYDDIDAHSAGFTLNNVPLCNTDGASYIFYAIAA